MSHGSNHGASADQAQFKISFGSAFWLVLSVVLLFVASLNFIQVMGHGHEEGHEGQHTEMKAGHEGGHEAAAEEHATEAPKHEAAKEGEAKTEAPKAEAEHHEAH